MLTCVLCEETKNENKFFKVDGNPTRKCLSCLFPSYYYPQSKPTRAYKKRTPKPKPEPEIKEPTPRQKKPPVVYQSFSPKEGYVYLLSSSVGLYKIGMAKDVSRRMSDFDRTIPIETKCIHFIKTSDKREAEKFLHNKFSEFRVKYEWFQLSPEQVEWICSLGEIDSLFDVRNRSET